MLNFFQKPKKEKIANPDGTILTPFQQDSVCAGFAITGKLGSGIDLYKAKNAQRTYAFRADFGKYFNRFFGRANKTDDHINIVAKMYTERHKGTQIARPTYWGSAKQTADYFKTASNNYNKPLNIITQTPVMWWSMSYALHALSITSKGNGQCVMRDSLTGKLKGDCTEVYKAYEAALESYNCRPSFLIASVAIDIPSPRKPKFK